MTKKLRKRSEWKERGSRKEKHRESENEERNSAEEGEEKKRGDPTSAPKMAPFGLRDWDSISCGLGRTKPNMQLIYPIFTHFGPTFSY